MKRSQSLFNPVVADLELGVLIDGHHRAAAFAWIGMDRIPCYDVRYLSSQVTVRGWFREIDATASQVVEAFEWFGCSDTGNWRVVAVDQRQNRVAVAGFEDSLVAAQWLEHLALYLGAGGHRVTLVPGIESTLGEVASRIFLYLDPIPGKQEVLAAIQDQSAYPEQVNRHLITDRPLGLNLPLEAAMSISAFEAFTADNPVGDEVRVEAGVLYDDRWFEERVRIFGAPSGG